MTSLFVAGCFQVYRTIFCRILCSFFDALLRIVADMPKDANENAETGAKELVIHQ